jgi:hypothetical protein
MAQQSNFMIGMMNKQFAQQQSIMKMFLPQLQQMATNPQGFGAAAMAAMRSQTINTIGSQLASQQAGLRSQFATANMPGLGSGAQAAISATLAGGAAGAEASNLQQLSIANEQAKQQQQQYALTGMQQMAGMTGQQSLGFGGLGVQAGSSAMQGFNQAFQNQATMAQQGDWWQNALIAGIGGAASLATGGLSNLVRQAPGASAWGTSSLNNALISGQYFTP